MRAAGGIAEMANIRPVHTPQSIIQLLEIEINAFCYFGRKSIRLLATSANLYCVVICTYAPCLHYERTIRTRARAHVNHNFNWAITQIGLRFDETLFDSFTDHLRLFERKVSNFMRVRVLVISRHFTIYTFIIHLHKRNCWPSWLFSVQSCLNSWTALYSHTSAIAKQCNFNKFIQNGNYCFCSLLDGDVCHRFSLLFKINGDRRWNVYE